MSCKVGNQTNSQDPQAVNSRVFVGNLNTFQCSKTDVERRFQRYGRIAGISMHKGYAFIQFTNPFDARSACLGEDGRLLWGQTLDVNLVAEPKAHQTGRKRQNVAKTGNDWDYYYDSYYAQVGFPAPRLVPPMKRARIHVPPTVNNGRQNNKGSNKQTHANNNTSNASFSNLKSYSTPDILICGNCREMFTEVEQLMDHKKTYCKLRFTCKCHMLNGFKAKSPGEEPASLLCSQCKDSFHSAWDLMVHVQAAHMLNIYQLGADTNNRDQLSIDSNGVNGGDGAVVSVGTVMSDMEDSGENHKCETNSSFQAGTSGTAAASTTSAACSSSTMTATTAQFLEDPSRSLCMEVYKPELNGGGGGGGVFPMEASTQTTSSLDNPNNMTTNNFDEHCGALLLPTKVEPPTMLLALANGQA